jgi:hypothetical protein
MIHGNYHAINVCLSIHISYGTWTVAPIHSSKELHNQFIFASYSHSRKQSHKVLKQSHNTPKKA